MKPRIIFSFFFYRKFSLKALFKIVEEDVLIFFLLIFPEKIIGDKIIMRGRMFSCLFLLM